MTATLPISEVERTRKVESRIAGVLRLHDLAGEAEIVERDLARLQLLIDRQCEVPGKYERPPASQNWRMRV